MRFLAIGDEVTVVVLRTPPVLDTGTVVDFADAESIAIIDLKKHSSVGVAEQWEGEVWIRGWHTLTSTPAAALLSAYLLTRS